MPKVPELIPEVIRYINGHFTESLTLDLICAEFFVSKISFDPQIQEYTNATVYDYILSKRIALARRLIRQARLLPQPLHNADFRIILIFINPFLQKPV